MDRAEHSCNPPVDPIHGPDEWMCPACRRVWERREGFSVIGGEEFFDTWFQPRDE
ncbi:hypothetical protein HS041_12415 [Planomonospora sp. ID67723]|uniref:hypothetical protein n=1 Tax=Planomonospora sp. ID67723 TaxID=2738134 RepID=UPI0018C3541E|nr:hypothetical protein [Planomonospora sp. ID67723]MBG0828573.1 hypothetical protein [Planomonospora sp. ID67723]